MPTITNNQARNLLDWYELTEEERKDFDWLETEDEQLDTSFFRYRGVTYCTDEFAPALDLQRPPRWHGIKNDTYFSGILIKYVDNLTKVIVGRFYS